MILKLSICPNGLTDTRVKILWALSTCLHHAEAAAVNKLELENRRDEQYPDPRRCSIAAIMTKYKSPGTI